VAGRHHPGGPVEHRAEIVAVAFMRFARRYTHAHRQSENLLRLHGRVDRGSGGAERRATASGLDIYAVTAPLVAEALERVLTGRTKTVGVASAGEIFDAPDFLQALAPHIALDLHPQKQTA